MPEQLVEATPRRCRHCYSDIGRLPAGTWADEEGFTFCVKGVAHDPLPRDAFASDEEYLDNVECSECGETRGDATSCELSLTCTESGCSCVVARISSCDSTDGMYACVDHTPSHRGCPECDPPERDDR